MNNIHKFTSAKFLATTILTTSIASTTFAGGYLSVNGAVPKKWVGTVTMRFDQGPLGALNNTQANTLANNALQKWSQTQIPGCSLVLQQDPVNPFLSQDHALNNGTLSDSPTYGNGVQDFISPMIYDQFGYLTDSQLGVGANQSVIGFAGTYVTNSTTIFEGYAVINGRFIDTLAAPVDISQSQMEGVIAHEIGHMLNLDHSQGGVANTLGLNATFVGFPTMYPIAHSDIADLELDDKTWISNLYPTGATTANTTKISGVTRLSNGTAQDGIDVVARSASNPNDIITCVSGYLSSGSGAYDIPVLPSGSQWVIDVEQIDPAFTGGSRIGPANPQFILPGPPEFITQPGVESNSDSLLQTTTFVTGAAATTLSGIDVTLNSNPTPTTQIEVDNGSVYTNPVIITGLSVGGEHIITGTLDGSEAGDFAAGGDDFEDYYAYNPPVGIEVREIKLTPNAGQDANVWVIEDKRATLGFGLLDYGFTLGNGVVEDIFPFVDTSNLGSGAGAGRLLIAVSTPAASGIFPYTLSIKTAVSDKNALVVTKPASINPKVSPIILTGRNFNNTGGTPTVTFSDPKIQVNSVTYINSTQLNVAVTALPGFTPSSTVDIQVTNPAGALSYGGRTYNVTAVPVALSSWELE